MQWKWASFHTKSSVSVYGLWMPELDTRCLSLSIFWDRDSHWVWSSPSGWIVCDLLVSVSYPKWWVISICCLFISWGSKLMSPSLGSRHFIVTPITHPSPQVLYTHIHQSIIHIQRYKQLKCPLIGIWINEICCAHIMKYDFVPKE